MLKGAVLSLRQFLLTESPLKVMKNYFYFMLKARLAHKIFEFLSCIFGHVKKPGLIRKIKLISKFITSQPG